MQYAKYPALFTPNFAAGYCGTAAAATAVAPSLLVLLAVGP